MKLKLFSMGLCGFALWILNGNAFAQTAVKKPVGISDAKKNVTPLIVYDVIIYDTAKIENVAHQHSGENMASYEAYKEKSYLMGLESKMFRYEMEILLKKGTALFCDWGFYPMTPAQVGKKRSKDVLVMQYDSLGNPLSEVTMSDTISLHSWQKVTFYESWNLDKKSGMITKDVLAYGFSYYNKEKEFWIPLFILVKDEETRKKLVEMTWY
ncbi:MAG: hypothetical protein IAF38_10265 [Bacteroidia bacterium]|nr:hypothetical protein [Bacteroidia bacterium]